MHNSITTCMSHYYARHDARSKKHQINWLLPKFWRALFFLWFTLCYTQWRWNPAFRALNYFSEIVKVIKVTLEESMEFQKGNWNWSSNWMGHISYWFMLMTLNYWGMKTSAFRRLWFTKQLFPCWFCNACVYLDFIK